MSLISRLFRLKSREIALRKGIVESKESLLRLEIMTIELNKKDKEAKSHEKLLQIAFDDLDTAIWGKDVSGHFVFMNLACAEKILHTTIENGLAMTDADFANDALSGTCMASDKIVMETKKTHRQIEYAKYPNGNIVFLDTTKSPWIIDEKIVGTVGAGKIISDFVPGKVKKKCKSLGFVEIPIDLIYNSEDISEMILSG